MNQYIRIELPESSSPNVVFTENQNIGPAFFEVTKFRAALVAKFLTRYASTCQAINTAWMDTVKRVLE